MEKGFIISLIFSIIVGVFALANSEKVVIDFIFGNIVVSQALVIILSALLGALVIFFISTIKSFRYKQQIKKLEDEIDSLKEENLLMKNLNEEYMIENKELGKNSIDKNNKI